MAGDTVDPFSEPLLLIITGANRGYGYALAKTALSKLRDGSTLLITGRNQTQLDEVKDELLSTKSSPNVDVVTFQADLSLLNDFSTFLENALKGLDTSKFVRFMLINNAASLGDVTCKLHQYSDASAISQYMDLNVSSVTFLTAKFVDKFASNKDKCFVINISSLCALKPFAACALYCAGKAARDMVFKVLAVERADVRVLNWAPGPMPTEMMKSMMHCNDEKNAAMFQKLAAEKTYVECMDSAEKLFAVLQKNEFVSGDHIDYYDV